MATGWGGRRLGGRRSFRGPTYEDFVPPSGWTEDPERHNLMIDLPGFKMEDVKLRVDEKSGQLMVGGERKVDDQNKFRRFEVKVKLPDNSDATFMSAKFEGNVLLVVIPKEKKLEKENSEGDRNDAKKEKEPSIPGDGEIEQKSSSNNNGVVAPQDSGNGEAEKKTASNESEEKVLSAEAEAKNGNKSEIASTNPTNNEAEHKSISHREEIDQTSLKTDEGKSVINSGTEEKNFQENEAKENHLSNSETEKNLIDNEAKEKHQSKNDTEEKISNNGEIEQNYPTNDEDNTEKKGDAEPLKKTEGTQTRVNKVHFHEEGVEKDGEKGNQLQSAMKMINEHKACILSALVAFALGLLASRSKK